MFDEFSLTAKYGVICLLVVIILFSLSFFFVYQNPDKEKLSSYECGFNPFSDARNKFEVRFYLVAVLFLIFDLEISFLFPWIIAFNNINLLGYITMMLFLLLLTLGFIYEWSKGALEWE